MQVARQCWGVDVMQETVQPLVILEIQARHSVDSGWVPILVLCLGNNEALWSQTLGRRLLAGGKSSVGRTPLVGASM